MTTVLLVRHGEHVLQAHTLVGRGDDAPISSKGQEQIRRLVQMLETEPIAVVHSSPRARARETAAAIAARHGLPIETQAALDELDYGKWTGLTFDELSMKPEWHAWNERRAETAPPQGESMRALQLRVLGHLDAVRKSNPRKTVVAVSHAEPIRAALLHAANIPLNDFTRIDVLPGSITRLMLVERAFPGRNFLKVLSG